MKMSLTRILNEIKLLDKKIDTAGNKNFIFMSVGGKPATGFDTVKDMEDLTEANYKSVVDLISRRNHLKSVLTQANATTKVKVAGEEMTIAQAIDRKSSILLEKNLLSKMIRQQSTTINQVNEVNQEVERRVTGLLEASFGTDKKVTDEQTKAISEPYEKKHKATVVDKIKIRDKIESINSKIVDFENEVDFALSEINALTQVEVD